MRVVDVTIESRELNSVPNNWYVIEDAHIDGVLIWQDETGAVYQTSPGGKQKKIADSLAEFMKLDQE